MVCGMFFCATLTGHKGGYILFLQVGAETSDTSVGAVKQGDLIYSQPTVLETHLFLQE